MNAHAAVAWALAMISLKAEGTVRPAKNTTTQIAINSGEIGPNIS